MGLNSSKEEGACFFGIRDKKVVLKDPHIFPDP